ncbi:hypothetical protein H1R20_g1177, partial [Candolleomyces eurysporus]
MPDLTRLTLLSSPLLMSLNGLFSLTDNEWHSLLLFLSFRRDKFLRFVHTNVETLKPSSARLIQLFIEELACLTPQGLLIDSFTDIICRVTLYSHSDKLIWGALASGTLVDGLDYEEPKGLDLINTWWDENRPSPDINVVIADWADVRMKLRFKMPPSLTSPDRQKTLKALIKMLDASMHATGTYVAELRASQGRTHVLLDRFNCWAHQLGKVDRATGAF